MPRIRQYAQEYIDKDFLKEISLRKIHCGVATDKELAINMGICPNTLTKRKQKVENFTVAELRGLIRAINPDPVILLKFLGYTSKDIPKNLISEGTGHL